MPGKRLLFALGSISLLLGAAWQARPVMADVPPQSAGYKKVMIVIFENIDYSVAMGQPFFAKLAHDGANLANFTAQVHPSQGNYIALTSGGLQGVTGDGNMDINSRNVVDLLEAQGHTWKVYAEGYPGNCFKGATRGRYARKHNPFISYTDISGNAQRCAHIVNADQLAQDVQNDAVPDYSFYVPDMDNDGHDTGVAYADRWYSGKFGPLMLDQRFMHNMLLISTFDESSLSGGNHIYTVFNGDAVTPGSVSNVSYNHYSTLHTIEAGLGLSDLGAKDAQAPLINGIWR